MSKRDQTITKITNRIGTVLEVGNIVYSDIGFFSLGKIIEFSESKNGTGTIYAKVIPYVCDKIPYEELPVLEMIKIDCLKVLKDVIALPWNVRDSESQDVLREKY